MKFLNQKLYLFIDFFCYFDKFKLKAFMNRKFHLIYFNSEKSYKQKCPHWQMQYTVLDLDVNSLLKDQSNICISKLSLTI